MGSAGQEVLPEAVQEVQASVEPLQQPDRQGAAHQLDAIASMSCHICTETGDMILQSHAVVSNLSALHMSLLPEC